MKNFIQNILFGCAFLLIGTTTFGQTTFNFTGNVQTFTVPTTGNYQLEAWGAQGGNDLDNPTTHFGGRGGYTSGELTLTAGQTLYIYVGSQGDGCLLATWHSSGGGGATDIRLVGGLWNANAGLYSRIIVAGGGGGRHGNNQESAVYVGNDGGGLTSPSFVANGITVTGSTQTDGGSSTRNDELSGFFGYSLPHKTTNTCSVGGYNGASRGSDGWANGGAGGGWWGGCDSWPTSAGGSSYVLTSTSVKPVGYTPTAAHWMNNDVVIAGNAVMPDPNGGNMTGNTGDGVARITLLCNPLTMSVTPDDTVCLGTPATITGTSTGVGTITWDNGITNGVSFPNTVAGVTTYTSTSTDPNDCVAQVTINVLAAKTGSVTNTICNNGSVVVNGNTYDANTPTGTEVISNVGPFNCDSTVTVNLTVLPALTGSVTNTICNNGSVVVNGNTYDANTPTGTEVFTNVGPNNCDSTVTVNLNVLPALTGSVTNALCGNDSIIVNGTTYNSGNLTGTEVFTNVGPSMCDSTVTVNITVNPLPTVAIAAFTPDTVCDSDPAINLPAGTPALGTYSGTGVVGTTFDPNTAGVGAHYVMYSFTDSNTCTNMDSTMIVVISCVGIDENGALAGVNIYPNPTNNILNITLGNITSDVNLTLTSVEGKVVYQENNVSDNKVSVDISNNSKGIYFLKVETNNQYKVYKVIKE